MTEILEPLTLNMRLRDGYIVEVQGQQGYPCFLIMVRKDCKYSDADLICILPYKSEYMSSTTQERVIILRKEILPSMFNHWMENGKEYDLEESRVLSKVRVFKISVIRLKK